MRNSVVTFPRTVVPKGLEMFRESVSVRTGFAEVAGTGSSSVSWASLERASDGRFCPLSSVS